MANLLLMLVGCLAPTPSTALTRPTATGGIEGPQPGWRLAADEAVVWHGRVHTLTGDDVVVLRGDEPLVVVGAPRLTDVVDGPFPVIPEDAGPRVLVSPFSGGIVQDVAVAGWMLDPEKEDIQWWAGAVGRWLRSADDLLGTGRPQVFMDADLYEIEVDAVIQHWPTGVDLRIQGLAPSACDVRGSGESDVLMPTGLALGPVPRPLDHGDLDTAFFDVPLPFGTICLDLDGNGDDEILAALAANEANDASEMYVLLDAPPSGTPVLADVADATWSGPPLLGVDHHKGLVTGGDMNGDGTPDVFVGAPNAEVPAASGFPTTGGRAWVLTDPLAGGELDVGAHAIFEPTFDHDRIGAHATFGDFDGDGADDIAISYASPSRVAVFRGPLDAGTYTDEDADAVFYGQDTLDDGFGLGLAAGDLDEDGRDDLVIGAPLDDTEGRNGGAVYLLWGSGL